MDQPRIAVTGASGHLGGAVVRRVAGMGMAQRLIVRDPTRAPRLPGASVICASYEDIDAMTNAFRGVESLLFVSAHEGKGRVRLHAGVVEAAARAEVEHVVYTSFLGASYDSSFTYARDHYETERLIRSAGVPFTFLRSSFYLDHIAAWADGKGVISGPADNGLISWTARGDLADVAAAVLTCSNYRGKTYDVTGPRLLTMSETADELSRVTGRPYWFQNETVEQAYRSRRLVRPTAPPWELDGWIGTYLAIARDEMAVVSTTIEDVAGHAPTDIAEFYGDGSSAESSRTQS